MAAVNKVLGTYRADFGGSPIYITINYTNGLQVAGFNVHKGLRRNLKGELKEKGEDWELQLKEPGDHEFDGAFTLVFDHDFTKAKGTWEPQNTKSLSKKSLALEKIGQQERTIADGIVYEIYAGDKCDISFEGDGSCEFNFYRMLPDSTFESQMTTARGTWKQQGEKVFVTWQNDQAFGKRDSQFDIKFYSDTAEDGTISKAANEVEGEGYLMGIVF